jgi:hypothetical protein
MAALQKFPAHYIRWFITLIKWSVTLGLLYLLYLQLFEKKHLQDLMTAYLTGNKSPAWPYLLLSFVLMPVNWLLEARKWKMLTSGFEGLSLRQSLASVLSGVSVGILTPGRIGEYGGRLARISPQNHAKALGATFTGSVAQNTTNLVLAIPLSYFFLNSWTDATFGYSLTFVFLALVIALVSLGIYFNMPGLAGVLNKWPLLKNKQQWIEKLSFAESYHRKMLWQVLGLSGLRFGVYTLQYLCVMWCLRADVDIGLLSGAVATIYIVQSGMPLPPLTALMARSELAILVWGHTGVDAGTAMAATFTLWMINLLIPAFAGLVLIWNSKYFSKHT